MTHLHAPLLAATLTAVLGVLGCAHQPYPPLPEDLATQSSPTYAPPLSAEAAAARTQAPEQDAAAQAATGSAANVSEVARREAAMAPVSQVVDPLPPDPQELPDAGKRQLDILLGSQRFNYYEDDQLVWSGLISSGAPEHPTPRGEFRVTAKDRHKRSGSYTNYFDRPTPMPYALQFLGPYWVHEGYVPNEPASHGCVRLRYEDARFVYARMRVGDPVHVID
jgi:lipoprotein-anchoring transpeptidase ErfK/SrfK